jgi:hypothetical protein
VHLLGLLDDNLDLLLDLMDNNLSMSLGLDHLLLDDNNSLLSLDGDLLGDLSNVFNGDLQVLLGSLQDNLLLLDNLLGFNDLLVSNNLLSL